LSWHMGANLPSLVTVDMSRLFPFFLSWCS
jgi:hypothetical protein